MLTTVYAIISKVDLWENWSEMILICWLAAAKYGKKVAVLDYVSPSPQGREIRILLM